MKNNEFYDILSSNYDSMINFDKSVENKISIFKNIILPDWKSAADIGCGTGVDSIALAKCGLDVTSFDPSEEMINKAKCNFKKYEIKANAVNKGAEEITGYDNGFDAVFSLGNAFANIDRGIAVKSAENMYKISKPGGAVIIQVLNYEMIRQEGKRVVNITKDENFTYVRFYDFKKRDLNFNILKFNNGKLSDFELISTEIIEYKRKDFLKLFSNFTEVKFYGNLKLEEYSDTSKDLILMAFK